MCAGGINWCSFNWEAFATLATGLAAVLGAVVVGWRQTEILQRQTTLQEKSLKQAVFDRRYSVLRRTEQYLSQILVRGDAPDPEIERDFFLAKGEARFLFGNAVAEGLDAIWRDVGEYVALKRTMDGIFRREGHYGDGNPERQHDRFRAMENHLRNVPDLFGEMKLG